uniref:Chromo domain-containing protein n=1 Tax=Mycena chlorophos TaxID=658473 RepID=A0ABQ0M524_MYCCL|nr:predicted protein [Mycena chlorophos]
MWKLHSLLEDVLSDCGSHLWWISQESFTGSWESHCLPPTDRRLDRACQPGVPPPPPDLIDDHDEFEVQEIVNSRKFQGNIQFKIWYKGHLRSKGGWHPATDAENVQDKVCEYFAPGKEEWFEEYLVEETRRVALAIQTPKRRYQLPQ